MFAFDKGFYNIETFARLNQLNEIYGRCLSCYRFHWKSIIYNSDYWVTKSFLQSNIFFLHDYAILFVDIVIISFKGDKLISFPEKLCIITIFLKRWVPIRVSLIPQYFLFTVSQSDIIYIYMFWVTFIDGKSSSDPRKKIFLYCARPLFFPICITWGKR